MSSMRRGSGPTGLEKYRVKLRSRTPAGDDELRISVLGRIPRYVVEAARMLNDGEKKRVVVKATGNAIPSAITLTEVLKRRFSNLHQQNTVGTSRIIDTFEPLEVGLDQVTVERDVPFLEVTLTTNIENLDTSSPGYQPPIDQSLVRPLVEESLSRSDVNQGYARRGGGPRRGGVRGGRSDTNYRGRGGPPRGREGLPRGRGGSLYQGSRGGGFRGRGGVSWSNGGYQDESTTGYYRGGRGGMRGRDGYFGGPRGRGNIERQMPQYQVASVKNTDDVA